MRDPIAATKFGYLKPSHLIKYRNRRLQEISGSSVKKEINLLKIKEKESEPDFFSAIKICKRRRIGPMREESNRSLFYKKDISILARSGFSYTTSKTVLNLPKDEFKKFCKLL